MTFNRRLGLGALACGLAAALAGSPYRPRRAGLDVAETARAIMEGRDHIKAIELAAWIRDRKPGLRVIDVRPAGQFATSAIPTAENLPLDALLSTRFSPHESIVLYSEGGAHAGQAWTLLRAMGVLNAWFIAGGLADWHDEVLAPGANSAVAELTRYFGGMPTVGDGAVDAARPVRPRRRGC